MLTYYTYWIVFHGKYEDDLPVVYYDNLNKLKNDTKGTMHLLDINLTSVTSAVEFVMHLPRTELDLYNLHEEELNLLHDMPHQIILVPDSRFISIRNENVQEKPTLVVYSMDCDFGKEYPNHKMDSELGYFCTEELNEALLRALWVTLSKKSSLINREKLSNIETHYLTKDEHLKLLPLLFFARQYNNIEYTYEQIYNSSDVERRCMELLFNFQLHQNTLVALRKNGFENIDEAMANYERHRLCESRKRIINLILTIPGVSRPQVKYGGVSKFLPNDEKR